MANTVVRVYDDAVDLFEVLASNTDAIKELITTIPGFIQYGLFRTESGGFSITSCQDQAGIDESIKRAGQWITDNAPDAAVKPTVLQGETLAYFGPADA